MPATRVEGSTCAKGSSERGYLALSLPPRGPAFSSPFFFWALALPRSSGPVAWLDFGAKTGSLLASSRSLSRDPVLVNVPDRTSRKGASPFRSQHRPVLLFPVLFPRTWPAESVTIGRAGRPRPCPVLSTRYALDLEQPCPSSPSLLVRLLHSLAPPTLRAPHDALAFAHLRCSW